MDRGNPQDLGNEHHKLNTIFPHLHAFGGCCGTDEKHVLEIVRKLKQVED